MRLVPIREIVVFQMLFGWTCGTMCFSRPLGYAVEHTKADWSIASPHLKCLNRCSAKFRRTETGGKPYIVERIFPLERRKVDCLDGNIKRDIHDAMADMCKAETKLFSSYLIVFNHKNNLDENIPLEQLEDLPLFYYKPDIKKSKLEAEKMCAKLNLNFGFEPSLVTQLLKKLEPFDAKDRTLLWSQEIGMRNSNLSHANSSMECYANWISNNMLIKQTLDCKDRINFVCILPWWCHQEVCSSRCIQNGIDLCKPTTLTTYKSECYPSCANVNCVDEMSHSYAQTYCCGKGMRLLALEESFIANCISKNIFVLASTISSNNSFWTSGSSDKCPNSFGWCGVKEFVSFEALGIENLKSAGGKECISVTFEKSANTTALALRSEECGNRKRVICEKQSNKKCTESKCLNLNCTREINHLKQLAKSNISTFIPIPGCNNKTIYYESPMTVKLTYYKAHKYACAKKWAHISFQTKEKRECVEASLLANKVPAGKYWVSAETTGCLSVLRWCDKMTNPIVDFKKASYLNWKKGEPSSDPLKECTIVDFQYTKPHLTFSKSDCNAGYLSAFEEIDPLNIKIKNN